MRTAAGSLYFNTGGIYLHSTPIPYDTTILAIKEFGYAQDDVLEDVLLPDSEEIGEGSGSGAMLAIGLAFLYVVVYRLDQDSGQYNLVHGPELLLHDLEPGFLPMTVGESLGWAVREGDLVGVSIPSECAFNTFNGTVFRSCPSQPNLIIPAHECLSALYAPSVGTAHEDIHQTISMDALEEVQVRLNMEVFLGPGIISVS